MSAKLICGSRRGDAGRSPIAFATVAAFALSAIMAGNAGAAVSGTPEAAATDTPQVTDTPLRAEKSRRPFQKYISNSTCLASDCDAKLVKVGKNKIIEIHDVACSATAAMGVIVYFLGLRLDTGGTDIFDPLVPVQASSSGPNYYIARGETVLIGSAGQTFYIHATAKGTIGSFSCRVNGDLIVLR